MRRPLLAAPLVPLVLASACIAAGQSRAAVETIDLMPLYWRFWERAQSLPVERQAALFRELVVAQRPEIYNADVMQVPGGGSFADAVPAIYPKAVAWTSPHEATMRRLSREIGTTLPQQEAAFRRTFPDFRFEGRVYFLYALGAFDGAVRQVEGRPALLFGLDVIAAVNGEDASLAPLVHHELFHAYHGPLIGTTGRGHPLYLSVWVEGLATLVARQLNPDASDIAIFGLPTNTPRRTRDDLPQLASLLRKKLDSSAADDYDTFFTGNEPDATVPRRSGYFLGYLAAKRIQRGRSLQELARLTGPDLRQAIEAALADPVALASSDVAPGGDAPRD
jgi:hypothetical protein